MSLLSIDSPQIMAIVNVTPDSFSDGGLLTTGAALNRDALRSRVEAVLAEGATIIDIGGESTRPGAQAVSLQEELDRVMPAIEIIRSEFDSAISLDSSKPEVMKAGAAAGVALLNDVRSFTVPGALDAAVETGLPICLMHMQGEPGSMQNKPRYENVVDEVYTFLSNARGQAISAGVSSDNILIDPGFGFGKTLEHNLALLRALPVLAELAPLLVGVSRKRMIGEMTSRDLDGRAVGSAIVAYQALQMGARILRVHDVAETRDALRIYNNIHGVS